MILALLSLLGGLALLVAGGEALVRGAVRLAEKARVSALLIGLVVVGFGTSMPELVTSVEAALVGSPAIAWGNIAGSNLANTLLILGATALIAPIALARDTALRDTGMALGAALVLLAVAITGVASSLIGVAMLVALFTYIIWCYREERQVEPEVVHNAPYDRGQAHEVADPGLHALAGGWLVPGILTLAGLGLLVLGGRLLVDGAIELARLFGLTETLIGLTVVAIGTSLPELVTSLIAARKGQADLAFGNVVGSNLYNILFIGGTTMLIAPGPVPPALLPLDLGAVTASAALLLIFALALKHIDRRAGLPLLLAYFAYMAWLIASAG